MRVNDFANISDEELAQIFKALCDVKRIKILKLLRSGSKCACEIMEALGIAQSALSYHMKILVESSLVDSWIVGKWTHYRLSKSGGTTALEVLQILMTEE